MKELAAVFLRLGITAFGGPAAHIAMMEDEFVRRRAWLTREQFLDIVGAAGLIPGCSGYFAPPPHDRSRSPAGQDLKISLGFAPMAPCSTPSAS